MVVTYYGTAAGKALDSTQCTHEECIFFWFEYRGYIFSRKGETLESQLELLKKLQKIDIMLSKIDVTRSEVPKKLQRLEKDQARRGQQLEKEKQTVERLNEERRKKELKLKGEIDRLRKSQEKLHSVKTNREYHAALKEIEDINTGTSELETEILICMEEADTLKKRLTEQEIENQRWNEEFEKQRKEFQCEVDRSDEESVQLQRQRKEMLDQIEPFLISKYELIRERRQGLAVVPIVNGLCQGCNINLPPQQFIELQKSGDTLINCPFCNRIIYVDGNDAR